MCTNFMIPLDEEKQFVVTARTMDFGQPMDCVLCMIPRGESFPLIPPDHAYRWTNTYGFVAMTAMISIGELHIDAPYYTDGLNEKGVSAALLWLPGTIYSSPSQTTPNLYMADLISLVLGMAADVGDAVTLLRSVNVIDFPFLRDVDYPPLHLIVCDANGDSVVVEFLDGAMEVTPCDNGVMTNAPEYSWHLLNLLNYENLSVYNSPQEHWGQEINGSGMLGLPGDATPPSRFVRITCMLDTIFPPADTQEAIGLASQLTQTVTVPYGTIASVNEQDEEIMADFTQWNVVRDHVNRIYYVATPFNPTLQRINLAELDFSASKRTCIPIVQAAWFNDITNQFPTT
ncbi:MAG: linear amide C-N hydrolase [Bacteroidetes bacterium]|nr:linear amide C-N hydrolase [Bacteroidota bacterium]